MNEINNSQMDKDVARTKLVLLCLSLASLVKSEEGFISELTFIGLLDGRVDLTKNDPYNTSSVKRGLIDAIFQQLSVLDPAERIQVLAKLGNYMATNPSVEELYDQQNSLRETNALPLENNYRQTPV